MKSLLAIAVLTVTTLTFATPPAQQLACPTSSFTGAQFLATGGVIDGWAGVTSLPKIDQKTQFKLVFALINIPSPGKPDAPGCLYLPQGDSNPNDGIALIDYHLSGAYQFAKPGQGAWFTAKDKGGEHWQCNETSAAMCGFIPVKAK